MKSIAFNEEMVTALRADRKTQTRRVIKPQPFADFERGADFAGINKFGAFIWYPSGDCDDAGDRAYDHDDGLRKPRYQPGDVAYVKEAYAYVDSDGFTGHIAQCHNRDQWPGHPVDFVEGCRGVGVLYRATDDPRDYGVFDTPFKWRSPRFMPRWAAREYIRFTGVRVEQIQSISNLDIIAEGVTPRDLPDTDDPWDDFYERWQVPFMDLWNKIHAKDGLDWDANPWVFVYGFERITKEEAEG